MGSQLDQMRRHAAEYKSRLHRLEMWLENTRDKPEVNSQWVELDRHIKQTKDVITRINLAEESKLSRPGKFALPWDWGEITQSAYDATMTGQAVVVEMTSELLRLPPLERHYRADMTVRNDGIAVLEIPDTLQSLIDYIESRHNCSTDTKIDNGTRLFFQVYDFHALHLDFAEWNVSSRLMFTRNGKEFDWRPPAAKGRSDAT